jgi:hypothetical protein
MSGLYIGAMMFLGVYLALAFLRWPTRDGDEAAYQFASRFVFGAISGGAMAIGIRRWWNFQKHGYTIVAVVVGVWLFLLGQIVFRH